MSNIDSVMPLIRHYYESNCSGGSLHIVLDDGNTGIDHVIFCLGYAKENNDKEGERLSSTLMAMSETEREEIYARYEEYYLGVNAEERYRP